MGFNSLQVVAGDSVMVPGVGRGGGYSGFQVTGMIEWGQKSKPKKVPGPNFNPQKSNVKPSKIARKH